MKADRRLSPLLERKFSRSSWISRECVMGSLQTGRLKDDEPTASFFQKDVVGRLKAHRPQRRPFGFPRTSCEESPLGAAGAHCWCLRYRRLGLDRIRDVSQLAPS